MKSIYRTLWLNCALWAALAIGLSLPQVAWAHDEDEELPAPGSTWEVETCHDHSQCGHVGPFIPMTYNAVGASMVWTKAFISQYSRLTPLARIAKRSAKRAPSRMNGRFPARRLL